MFAELDCWKVSSVILVFKSSRETELEVLERDRQRDRDRDIERDGKTCMLVKPVIIFKYSFCCY